MATGFLGRVIDKLTDLLSPAAPRDDAAPPIAAAPAPQQVQVNVCASNLHARRDDIEVTGESYRRAALARLFNTLGRPAGGVTMQQAQLVLEPKNPHDPNAVKVMVLGEHVGYIPAEMSASITKECRALPRGSAGTVLARVWASNDDGTWRGRVTLSFGGTTEDERDFAAEKRELAQRDAARSAEKARKLADRQRKEAEKAARQRAGSVRGEYWQNLKPAIAELKRQGRLDEALAELQACVDAAEREAVAVSDKPHPWPTEQCAAVLRRMKNHQAELQVLERYVALTGADGLPDGVVSKLARARIAAGAE